MQPFPTAELGTAPGGGEPPAAPPAARARQVARAGGCSAPPRPSARSPGVRGGARPPPPRLPGSVKCPPRPRLFSFYHGSAKERGSAALFPLEDPPGRAEPGAAPALGPPSGKASAAPPLPASLGPAVGAGRAVFGGPCALLSGGTCPDNGAGFPASGVVRGGCTLLTPSSPPLPDLARRRHPVYIKGCFSSREIKKEQGICFTMTYVQFSHPGVDLGL